MLIEGLCSSESSPRVYVHVCFSVLQRVAACCSVLQCVAVCCSVLQCVAVCCSVLIEGLYSSNSKPQFYVTTQ